MSNFLTEHLPHISAALATGVVTGALDHYIKKAEGLIPGNLWEMTKAFLTRQPIRAINALKGAPSKKGEINMSLNLNLDDFENAIAKLESLGSRLVAAVGVAAKAVEGLAPIAEAIAPLTGKAAPAVTAGAQAAEVIAPVVEKEAEALATHGQQPANAN